MTDLRTFTFGRGSHATREDGMCVMEAVAYLAGEPHSDHPKCASVVITRLAIWLNDTANDQLRQELLQYLPWRIVGTASTLEIEQQRAYMAADWAMRFVTPVLLRRAGLTGEANRLASLPIIDSSSAAVAYAAADAADAAARVAYAADAADAAARAADAAARATYATDAAADAADAAARAAYAAARATDDPEIIMRSCAQLLDRMIRLTEPQEAEFSERIQRVEGMR